MEQVGKLTTQEALAARDMWSEIFYEDSEQFTGYYFAEKMKDNRGYGVKLDKRLCAMLFLTPYTGRILSPDEKGSQFRDIPLFYIVGVGTKTEYRHRGYMDRLLRASLEDLHKEAVPFAFLMPADPAIYRPYQFRYIYERPVFSIRHSREIPARVLRPGEEGELAAFATDILESRYQFFLKRDAAYYRRQQKESRAQNGDIWVWKESGELAGFYLLAREGETEEIQEALATDRFAQREPLSVSEETRPVIMARLTCVQAMLSLMRLREGEPVRVCFRLSDPLIDAHNGTFLWTVGKKESTIALAAEEGDAQVSAEIGDLTEFLFGRKDCRTCFLPVDGGLCSEAAYEGLSRIMPLSRLFINEIV